MSRFSEPVQLASGVGIDGFSCGDKVVDRWAAQHSRYARERGTAVVYAVSCGEEIAGFYTLCAHFVASADVAGGWFTRNSPEQVPAVLLGMLGVDVRFQGCGLGASLLQDAVGNAMRIAALAGARALVVDPTSERAKAFYRHFGFLELPGSGRMTRDCSHHLTRSV